MSDDETVHITSPIKIYGSKLNKDGRAIRNLNTMFADKNMPVILASKVDEVAKKLLNGQDRIKLARLSPLNEKKSRRGRKPRGKSLSSSPQFSTRLHDPNSHLMSRNTESLKGLSGNDAVRQSQVPLCPSLKMLTRHDELKSAVEKSRQAFSAYKVSTFFCFNTEFIKNFGENLFKAEQAIKSMGDILEKHFPKQSASIVAQSPKCIENFSSPLPVETEIDPKLHKIGCGSLTPPASEAGNEEKDSINESTFQKKRKLKARHSVPITENTRKKCAVQNPVAPKMVLDMADVADMKLKRTKLDDRTSDSDCDSSSETKEGEFEVRKIQDYVRKQSGYFYRVSWHGYESDDDTYEPADHLDGCDEALVEFFYQRLKARHVVTVAEQLKPYVLPSDDRLKHLLYRAFEKLTNSLPKDSRERAKGIAVVTASKGVLCKSPEEIQYDILKFLAMREPAHERYQKLYSSIIEQISFKELFKEREKQLADLRAWERSMNIISSDPAPLSVENNVDLELPPLDFVYINEYIPGPDIIIPNDPVAGCDCKECSSLQRSCCASQMRSYFAYSRLGRLRVSLGTPIYECNKACHCPPDCINRVVQCGRKVSLSIFRTSNGRGWGVKALEPIKKDQFVSEYVGEVITSEEAEVRGMKYDSKGVTYLFDLDYNKGDQNPYTVDAMKYGNVSHFINHSCDPNLVVFNVWVNCLDPDIPKLALFAARDIRKGEEITFDYNSGSTRQISIIDKMDGENSSFPITPRKHETEDGSTIIPTTEFIRKTPRNRVLSIGKTECKCGSANCRKFFF